MKPSKKFLRDLAERVSMMFALTFLGQILVVDPADILDIPVLRAAAMSGIFAAASFVKGILARQVGDSDTASFFTKAA